MCIRDRVVCVVISSDTSSTKDSQTELITTHTTSSEAEGSIQTEQTTTHTSDSETEDNVMVITNTAKGAKPRMKLIIIVTVTVSIVLMILIFVTLCIMLVVCRLFKSKARRWPLDNNSRSYAPLDSDEMDSVVGQSQLGEESLSREEDMILRDENEL